VDIARGQLAGQQLCMEQYYRLLTSYRVPVFARDNLVSVKTTAVGSRDHVIVMCNNQVSTLFLLHAMTFLFNLTDVFEFSKLLVLVVYSVTCFLQKKTLASFHVQFYQFENFSL